MATSKTLTPTNVTISIPEMTDQPNASVFSNCVDKEADAINALSYQINNIKTTSLLTDIVFERVGKVVVMSIGSGSYKTDSSGYIINTSNVRISIPTGYRPTSNITFLESLAAKRVTILMDGTILLNNDVSQTNLAIRCSSAWITNDATPS